MLKRSFVLICILALMLGCSKKREPSDWPVLRIGYLPIAAELPLFVAIEQGFLNEQGIKYELFKFTSSNDLGNAASAGSIDVMAGTATNVVADIETVSGSAHQLVAINAYSSKPGHITDFLLVKKDSGITDYSQLKGKKIASFPGSVNRIFVNLILEMHGVNRDDYTYIEMPPPNWQPALASGAVDAVSALEPLATQIIVDGVGTSLSAGFYANLIPDPPLSGHWLAAGYYENADVGQVKAFLEAYRKAFEYIRNNEGTARTYLAKYAGVRADVAGRIDLNVWQFGKEIDPHHLQEFLDLLGKNGALKGPQSASTFIKLMNDSVW
jgi:ABC-type nitrate/sulfonate/bicarbonate transport system substrate-binding protein